MIYRRLQIFIAPLIILFFHCGIFEPRVDKGSIAIVLESEKKEMGLGKALEALSSVRYVLKKGSAEVKQDYLTKNGSYFEGTISDLDSGNDYSIDVYGYDSSTQLIGRGGNSSITVSAGQTATANITWYRFQPVLSTPTSGSIISDDTPLFDWNDITGTILYELQVSRSTEFSSYVIQQVSLTNSSYTTTMSLEHGMYYWRVRGKDSLGDWGAWSDISNFMLFAMYDTLMVTHSGPSSGSLIVWVADPSKLTGHDYKVTFKTDGSGNTLWDVEDVTKGTVVLADQTNQSGDGAYNVVDGLMIEVIGPDPGIDWNVVGVNPYGEGDEEYFMGWGYDGTRWVSGYDMSEYYEHSGLFGGLLSGFDFWGVYASRYVDVKLEFFADPGSDSTNWQQAYVIRRDEEYALHGIGRFPGKLWNVSVNPPQQLNITFVEDDRLAPANNLWDMGWQPDSSNYANVGYQGNREYIWMLDSPYDITNSTLLNADWYDGSDIGLMYAIYPEPRGSQPYLEGDFNLYIYAAKPNSESDIFSFQSPEASSSN